jgi:hypothetical protein
VRAVRGDRLGRSDSVQYVSYAAIERCTELRDAHIVRAVSSSESMQALLSRFAEIAAPGKGAPILLAALARLATTACDWIEGELRIELSGDAATTKIAVSTSLGAGFREKLFADTVLRVPLEEFSRGMQRAPRLIEPLHVKETGKRIVFTASEEVRKTSLPPPMVQIDPASRMVVPHMTVPLGLHDGAPSLPSPRAVAPGPGGATPPPKVVLRKRVKSNA